MYSDEDILEEEEKIQQDSKRSYYMHTLMVLMIVAVLILYFAEFVFIIISAGQKGVLFDRFGGGTNTTQYYDEGVHMIYPWNDMTIYDTRVSEKESIIEALTADGLPVDVIVSYRFLPKIDSLGKLHKTLGPQYAETILEPLVAAVTRNVLSHHRVDKLYSTSRNELQVDMSNNVREQIHDKYPIRVIDVLIKNIKLQADVEQSIADKLVEEQKMLAYEFMLQREQQEAKRKLIEAQGIRDFQDTSSINILQWRGIEATEKLAESPNSKVIVIGTSNDDLPIILGGN